MVLQTLVYEPLKEEDKDIQGWEKETIEYVQKNRNKTNKAIKSAAKNLSGRTLQKADVEDIYEKLMLYLHNAEDYDLGIAVSSSKTPGRIISLEGYIHTCIKFCVKRYLTEEFKKDKRKVSEHFKDEDGKELSLFDKVPDLTGEMSYNNLGYDLEDICRAYEHQRYYLGPDIFQVWFIMLKSQLCNKPDCYKDILKVLGITKSDKDKMQKGSDTEGVMYSIAKAVSIKGAEESLEIIRKYVYSADKLEEIIENY